MFPDAERTAYEMGSDAFFASSSLTNRYRRRTFHVFTAFLNLPMDERQKKRKLSKFFLFDKSVTVNCVCRNATEKIFIHKKKAKRNKNIHVETEQDFLLYARFNVNGGVF